MNKTETDNLNNLRGAGLYNLALRLHAGVYVSVRYDTIKAAKIAAAGACNKRGEDELQDSIKINRWTSHDNKHYVTVGRVERTPDSLLHASKFDAQTTIPYDETKRLHETMREDGLSEDEIRDILGDAYDGGL